MKKIFQPNNIKSFLSVFAISVAFVSCKKWIEIPAPKDRIPREFVFKDSASVMTAVAGVYFNMGYHETASSISGGMLSEYSSLSSDELVSNLQDLNDFINNSL